jgi:two-component system sensor histidine kinase UhpB
LFQLDRLRFTIPPISWLLPIGVLAFLMSFYGFLPWLLLAGLIFGTAMLRPAQEWPFWTLMFTLVMVIQVLARHQLGLTAPALNTWLLMDYLLTPLLLLAAVRLTQHFGLRAEMAASLRGMSLLHVGAATAGLLLMGKDVALKVIADPGMSLAANLPMLVKFGFSQFLAVFLGVMLLVPIMLWMLIPENRPGTARLFRSALIYLYLLPMLLYLVNTLINGPGNNLIESFKILLLVLVVIFSFRQGWRGAALSVLVVSVLIGLEEYYRDGNTDILQLQLYVAAMGAMALLFGASVDELRQKERILKIDKDRLQEALAALAESSRRSLHSEELERKRLARELHDEMGQTLTAMQAQMRLSRLRPEDDFRVDGLPLLEQLTQRLGQSLRSVVNALTPDELDQLGLYTAINSGSPAQMCEFANIDYSCEIYGDSQLLDRLDMLTNLAAYRIVQESVNNAIKHGHCEQVRVRLRIGERRRRIHLFVDVLDDGIGLKSLRQIEHGFYSIRDRAAALNGILHIHNRPGVRVHVLLRQ